MKAFKRTRKFIRLLRKYRVPQDPSQITIYNYPNRPVRFDLWLRDFIEHHKLLDGSKKKIGVFFPFGHKWMMRLNRSDIKIFIARENIHREQWVDYAQNALDVPSLDLSLGFDYGDTDRYMRFPLWIMWLFPPTVTFEDIKEWCKQVDSPENKSYKDRKFCSFLCSHDDIGRDEIYEQLASVGRVDCDGRYKHNNDELKQKYNDDKLLYLQHYRFNLCPENSSDVGYVTEKLFEAVHSGCVPIYSGNGGENPEPDIINPYAIIWVDLFKDNAEALKQIAALNSDEAAYMKFANQPRLMPDAAERIWGYIQELERRLRTLIND